MYLETEYNITLADKDKQYMLANKHTLVLHLDGTHTVIKGHKIKESCSAFNYLGEHSTGGIKIVDLTDYSLDKTYELGNVYVVRSTEALVLLLNTQYNNIPITDPYLTTTPGSGILISVFDYGYSTTDRPNPTPADQYLNWSPTIVNFKDASNIPCTGNENVGYTEGKTDTVDLRIECPNYSGPNLRCHVHETNCFEMGNITSFSYLRYDLAEAFNKNPNRPSDSAGWNPGYKPFNYFFNTDYGNFVVIYKNTSETINNSHIFCSYPHDGMTGDFPDKKLSPGCSGKTNGPSFNPDTKMWSDTPDTPVSEDDYMLKRNIQRLKTLDESSDPKLWSKALYNEVIIKTWNSNTKGARNKGIEQDSTGAVTGDVSQDSKDEWGWSDALQTPPIFGFGIISEDKLTTKSKQYTYLAKYINNQYPIVGIDLNTLHSVKEMFYVIAEPSQKNPKYCRPVLANGTLDPQLCDRVKCNDYTECKTYCATKTPVGCTCNTCS